MLGGKLVNRTASAVTLTELGAAILPHAQRILSVAQAAFFDMQQIVEAGGDGTVRIGLVPSVSFAAVSAAAADPGSGLSASAH
ncbi:putative transcriptional regulator [Klebsiella variicola]|uniref:Putative transcriptional regulator n=1 Tax=Klebsiella variicola TaxID=244366 RepID=A0A7H4MNU9_KLEVA|nr:putative transcriptional regulator [Klebsiella variicola]